jgi:lipid-A-disaccharide synthase-like uncharacterized protein
MVYGILRQDLAIILGQIVTYGVYLRNLYYHGFWHRIPAIIRILAPGFPLAAICWLLMSETYNYQSLVTNKDIPTTLLLWGILGQFVFTFRFVYQCFYSERKKESILPIGFWVISITGSVMVLSYAVIRKDPVLFVGQLFGVFVYSRNIMLGLRNARSTEE